MGIAAVNKQSLKILHGLFEKIFQIKGLNNHSITLKKIGIILRIELCQSTQEYNIYAMYRQRIKNKYCDLAIDLLEHKTTRDIFPVGLYNYSSNKNYIFWDKINNNIMFYDIYLQPALTDFVDILLNSYAPYISKNN